jgi:hypothetical protein
VAAVISEPLDKFIHSTRLCGAVLLIAFALTFMMFWPDGEAYSSGWTISAEERRLATLYVLLGQGVPGVMCFVLAWWMNKGSSWSFLAAIAFTILIGIKCGIGQLMPDSMLRMALISPCCAPLFLGYVGARALIAWPEIMHLRRVEAHERQMAKGFSQAPTPILATPPPPPARGTRPARP